jgi:hypothetical protein
MTKTFVILSCAAFAVISTIAHGQTKEVAENVKIQSPLPFQVIQRDPITVRKDNAGSAQVAMRWSESTPVAEYEWRLIALEDAFGKGSTWAAIKPTVSGGVCIASVALPAGGWYRLELRRPGSANVSGAVEPVGVGEVFLIAGQSYAANCNDDRLKVAEPRKRVACLDPKTGAWRVADDPQPGASEYKGGGTIWPAFGDGLVRQLKVPVGFANVAWQGTASAQWMPGQGLHKALIGAATKLGRFRAVLWQQGESDVIGGVPADTYVANITAIRDALAKEVGDTPVWMPAKSTIHPTVYNNPQGEAVIRGAVDRLWKTKGFFPGPDTDMLTGDNRGGASSCQHFSGKGQRNAAAMWVEAVGKLIEDAKR